MPKNRSLAVMRVGFLLAAALLSQAATCNLNRAIDNTLASFDNAIAKLTEQSVSWQQTLTKLEQDLVAQGQSTLANEVQSLMSRGISTAGVELRCEADFVGNRMREALTNIRARLAGQPEQPLKPWFCQIDPTAIDLRLVPERRSTVNVYGYNFDLGLEGVQAVLVDQDGSSTPLKSWLNSPTHYLLTLNTVNAPFRPTSLRVAFRLPSGEDRTVGIIQPDPCGAIGQPCCKNSACSDANATCASGTCRVQVSDVLIRGTICGLGHTQLLPNPSCNDKIIREGAPNGNCPDGWQLIHMCDMGAPGGTQFFACTLTSDTRVTALPQGLLCGYGHSDNNRNAFCGRQLATDGCPEGFQYKNFGDLGAREGHGFYGCVAGQPIPLGEAMPSAPRGTICGLSHTCNNGSPDHVCGGKVVLPRNPATCPDGFELASYGDLGASSGQGQYACVKVRR